MQEEILYRLGEFAQVLDHCQQGIDNYDPRQNRTHVSLFGNDTGIGCQMWESVTLWHLGYPDQALGRAEETLRLAREWSHPFTLVFVLYLAALISKFRNEVEGVQEWAGAELRLATERGFALYQAWGTVLQGWALAERGEIEAGIAEMKQGLAASRDVGVELVLPESLSFLAEAYGKAGQVEEGLRLVAEALSRVEETGESTLEAELYRLKGELLLGQVEAKVEVDRCYHEAEMCFERALEVARRQRAKSWELRAATSLSRLWQSQGKKEEARKLLQEVYGWFTEGFDTADLLEARALLDALA